MPIDIEGKSAPYYIYEIDPKSWGGKAKAIQFLGCGFPLNAQGIIATCKHVIEPVADGMIVIQHPTETNCHIVEDKLIHPDYDFSILKTKLSTPNWIHPEESELLLAASVWACGYYDHEKIGDQYCVIPQVFTGTVTSSPRKDIGLPTLLPFYQVSFPALRGFSGSPLVYDGPDGGKLGGMLFGNRSSKVIERYVDYIDENGKNIIEKSERIFESGVAHTNESIRKYSDDLGIEIWNN